MKRKLIVTLLTTTIISCLLVGCGEKDATPLSTEEAETVEVVSNEEAFVEETEEETPKATADLHYKEYRDSQKDEKEEPDEFLIVENDSKETKETESTKEVVDNSKKNTTNAQTKETKTNTQSTKDTQNVDNTQAQPAPSTQPAQTQQTTPVDNKLNEALSTPITTPPQQEPDEAWKKAEAQKMNELKENLPSDSTTHIVGGGDWSRFDFTNGNPFENPDGTPVDEIPSE